MLNIMGLLCLSLMSEDKADRDCVYGVRESLLRLVQPRQLSSS